MFCCIECSRQFCHLEGYASVVFAITDACCAILSHILCHTCILPLLWLIHVGLFTLKRYMTLL